MSKKIETEKIRAAHQSVKLVESGMVVGLGSGTTSEIMINSLGEAVKKGLSIVAVASSKKSENLAQAVGIPVTSFDKVGKLDMYIDGADEFDPKLRLIKGGGGALLREKILAHNSRCNVIIVDSSKQVDRLGNFKLPIETIPFATRAIIQELDSLGLKPVLRIKNGKKFRTDENNYIVDLDILNLKKVESLNSRLSEIPGIVETGLFLNYTDILIMGIGESTEVFRKNT